MTTIATRGDGIVAADSQCTWDSAVAMRVNKLHRLPDGGVVGGCGHVDEILRAVAWLQSGEGKPPKLVNCDVLWVKPDGRTGTLCRGGIFSESIGPIAIGSGQQAAMAAMNHYGASALEAVKAAASVDPNTSGPFNVLAVEPKPARRKRK